MMLGGSQSTQRDPSQTWGAHVNATLKAPDWMEPSNTLVEV